MLSSPYCGVDTRDLRYLRAVSLQGTAASTPDVEQRVGRLESERPAERFDIQE